MVNDQDCGLKSSVPLARFDPNTQSLKTAQMSLPGIMGDGSSECCGTWPPSGMMRNGIVYPLPILVPPMNGIGSGSLLPTPMRKSGRGHMEYYLDGGNNSREKIRRALAKMIARGKSPLKDVSLISGNGLWNALNEHGLKPGTLSSLRFVTWMMGFPAGYMEPPRSDLVMPSSPKSPR